MKILVLLITLLTSMACQAFPWYFGSDKAVLIPSSIGKQGSTADINMTSNAVTISPLLNIDNLRLDGNSLISTDTNGDILFTPDGTGNVGISEASPSSSLDVGGSMEGNGVGLLPTNLLINGDFEDGSPGPFSATTGSINPETTNVYMGENAVSVVDAAGTIDVEACVTKSQWEDRQAEVGCYVKSTLDDISLCFNDGTNDDTCNTSYDGSNVWKYVFQRGTPQTGEEMCIHITGSTAGTIELDNCVIKEPEFGTAELLNQQSLEYLENTTDFRNLGGTSGYIQWSTSLTTAGFQGDDILEIVDGTNITEFHALKDANVTIAFSVPKSVVNAEIHLYKNNSLVSRGSSQYAANQEHVDTFTIGLSAGDYIDFRTSTGIAALTSGASSYLHITASAKSNNVIVATENDQPFKAENNSSITISSASETRVVYAVDDGSVNDSFDPGNNYDTSTGLFTAPRSGDYKLKASCVLGNATSEGYRIRLRRVADSKLLGLTVLQTSNSNTLIVTNIAKLNKGDQVEVTMDSDSDTSYVCQQDGTNFEGHAIDSKALLAGLEDISVSPALYYDGTGDSIPNGVYTKVGYDTVVEDKDQLVSDPTTNWRFIAPVDGVYEFTAGALLLNATVNNGDTMALRLNINSGARFKDIDLIRHQGTFTSNYLLNGTVKVSLSEGDTVIVEAFQNSDTSLNLNASDTQSYISITKEEATLGTGNDDLSEYSKTPNQSTAGTQVLVSALVTDGASATTVSEEDDDFINGNCTNPATGSYTCTFTSSYWKTGTTPHCWVSPIPGGPREMSVSRNGVTSTSISFEQSGSAADSDFHLFCKGVK